MEKKNTILVIHETTNKEYCVQINYDYIYETYFVSFDELIKCDPLAYGLKYKNKDSTW